MLNKYDACNLFHPVLFPLTNMSNNCYTTEIIWIQILYGKKEVDDLKLQGEPKKPELRVHNFATVNSREACGKSKVLKFCTEKE